MDLIDRLEQAALQIAKQGRTEDFTLYEGETKLDIEKLLYQAANEIKGLRAELSKDGGFYS